MKGDRLCPAKMPVRPTMVIELKTAADVADALVRLGHERGESP